MSRTLAAAWFVVAVVAPAITAGGAQPAGAASPTDFAWPYYSTLLDWGLSPTSVSCFSSQFCMAVGDAGKATIWNGTSWSTPANVDNGRKLKDVSCATSTSCLAIDGEGYAVWYNAHDLTGDGSAWRPPMQTPGGVHLASVACGAVNRCFASAPGGLIYRWNYYDFVDVHPYWTTNPVVTDTGHGIAPVSTFVVNTLADGHPVGFPTEPSAADHHA